MNIGAIFFVLAVAILVGMYLVQPYIQHRGRRTTQEEHEYSSLMAAYDQTVNALQELEFDNTLGKVPAEDYLRQRANLLTKGADLLRQLDEFQSTPSSGERGGGDLRQVKDRVEAEAASRRADASPSKPVLDFDDDELESMIDARRKTRKEKSTGFCPKCGKAVLTSDRFCPSCGKAIN